MDTGEGPARRNPHPTGLNMFDRATFEEVTGGDPEAAREIAALLTGDARELLSEMETALAAGKLQQALQQTSGNKSRAARLLGISRDAFLYRLKKYHIVSDFSA